ncbi:TIGR04338 family metallohydrolase [Mycolicibacterium mengxianglii]|uniref:TIGR04338 family metallohydrolase n=1 Tax=Mycolicibacterium mengxianglii TaxID=2736649 RepID=UPI0018D1AA89|nr:TIGR04338 family metallohydrolase [Mycolicibacterium mengxianglii]
MSERDAQRSKVYGAEEFARTLFDRAAEHGSGVVDFFGTALTLPPEARFGSMAAVQRYVDQVLALPTVRARWPGLRPLTVRPRRGAKAAHYEVRDGDGVIAVPQSSTQWALRELVVLHEMAHHMCTTEPAHGPEFASTFSELAETVMGPEAGLVLRVLYDKHGVRLR